MGLGATTPMSADRRTIGAGRTHWVTTMLPGTPTMGNHNGNRWKDLNSPQDDSTPSCRLLILSIFLTRDSMKLRWTRIDALGLRPGGIVQIIGCRCKNVNYAWRCQQTKKAFPLINHLVGPHHHQGGFKGISGQTQIYSFEGSTAKLPPGVLVDPSKTL